MRYVKAFFAIVIINWFVITGIGLVPWPRQTPALVQVSPSITPLSSPQAITPTQRNIAQVQNQNQQQNVPEVDQSNQAQTAPAADTAPQQQQVQQQIQQPAPTDPPPPPPVGCLVVIQGRQYDVQRLRSTHSGGDIFACGTDMTGTFFSMHNQALLDGAMGQYLIQ